MERRRRLASEKNENSADDEKEVRLSEVQVDSIGRPEALEKLKKQAESKTTYLRENPNEKVHNERVEEL